MRSKNRMSLKVIYKLLVGFLAALSLFSGSASAQNPVPLINQPLVPQAIAPSSAGFTLTVNGTGFVSESVVYWNGSPRATAFVSKSRLTASIPASDIAEPSTASVTVVSPGLGGGTSNVAFFAVTTPTSSVPLAIASYGTADRSYSVAVGDFNGDSKLDLAVADYNANTISVLLGNGDGTFQAHVDYATGSEPDSVAVGDFNGDGKLDLAVANQFSNTISVLLGNGDGTFQARVDYSGGGGVTVGDFNGDGKLDLTDGASVLLGNGDGTFRAPISTGSVPASLAVGDFNRDGKLDLAVDVGNNVTILLGNGDGTFQPAVSYAVGSQPNSVAVADFNADDKLDLAVASPTGVSVLLGNGDGTFQTHVDYATGSSNNSTVAVGDFNGDGRPDLILADLFSTDVRLLLGNGDGTFAAAASYAAGSEPSSVAMGDFNGDGRLDIAVADSETATVSVLLQYTSVSLSQTGLTFADQVIHTSGAPQNVTLTNVGPLALSIHSIAVTGVDANDFSQTNTCGLSIPPQGSCTIIATFTPTLIGPRNASITITNNAEGSPQVIPLTGTGVVSGPNTTLSATSLTFATQLAGTTSPAQSVTLTNYGTVALSITGIGFTGADAGDFAETITCGSSVAPGASCMINVTFKPTGINGRTASLSITDNAPGSPQTISLSGVGTLNTNLTFADQLIGTSSASQAITLDNGAPSLTISSIAVTGTNPTDFSQTNTCGSGLPAGGRCTISVTFRPSQLGPRTASVNITDDAVGSPQTVALSGTGVVSGPNATLSATSLTFATQLLGTASPAQSVTLTNNGTAALSITGIAFTGADAGDFAETNTCGSSVAPGGSCTINVSFNPAQIDTRNGTLSVSDSASGSPHSVSLTGRGTVVRLSPPTISVACQHRPLQVCQPTTRATTLTNTGSQALTISSISSSSGLFSQTNNCPSTLPAQASCTITVTFRSGFSFGTFSGAVSISDNGGASPQQVGLLETVTVN